MSLTKEDLQAISDLIDLKLDEQDIKIQKRFDEQDKKFNKRFDEQDKKLDSFKEEFKEMLIDNNLLIAEHVQRVVQESEERLTKEIQQIKRVTADNCYNIAELRTKIS